MCDTMVATPSVTANKVMLFGKNSDREPNEAHHLVSIQALDHPAGSKVRMTYIEIPQVAHTHAVLLAKPFWIWGAEMGVNEHQVAIGNEAVFTKIPYIKEGGLIGMDLLRLGLERARTAHEALHVITALLAEYGQGGNCGFQHALYYHNSFLIADPHEAWVLETADRQWAARRVEGVYTISNGLTIGAEWDEASPDLVTLAVNKGWCKGRDDFHFARCYSDTIYTRFSNCHGRCERSTGMLNEKKGQITVQHVIETLRDHGGQAAHSWRPDRGITGSNVCMHAGFGPVRASQTVGSMVSNLDSAHPTHFFTATAAPCTSIFKPVWQDAGLPDAGPQPDGVFNPSTVFWRHEQLHRLTLLDYPQKMRIYQTERDELETDLVQKALASADRPAAERLAISAGSFSAADEAEVRWLKRVRQDGTRNVNGWLYRLAWNGFNRSARLVL